MKTQLNRVYDYLLHEWVHSVDDSWEEGYYLRAIKELGKITHGPYNPSIGSNDTLK